MLATRQTITEYEIASFPLQHHTGFKTFLQQRALLMIPAIAQSEDRPRTPPPLLWSRRCCLPVHLGLNAAAPLRDAKCRCAKLLCNACTLLQAAATACTFGIRKDLISLRGPMRNEQYIVHSGHNPWLLLTPHRNPFCLLLILAHSQDLQDEAEGTGAIYSL